MTTEIPSADQSEDRSQRPRQYRLRWSLLTLMLFSAAVCVWAAYLRFRTANPRLAAGIEAMEKHAHPLQVDDPDRMAVVKVDDVWFDEDAWQVYLPEGHSFQLILATRGIPQKPLRVTNEIAVARATPLSSGRHTISLTIEEHEESSSIVVRVDGEAAIEHDETADWDKKDFTRGGVMFERSHQPASLEQRVTLYRSNFVRDHQASFESTNGVMLVIKKVD